MCVKDTGTKYQLWISDFNIDGTFTRVHPFIINHTKTMTRTREDGKEEVFSACIKPDDTKYYNKYVRIIQVINYAKYFRINFIRNGKAYYADSRDKILFYSIHRLNHFPINFKITKYDWRIYTKSKKEKVKPQT